VQIDAQAQDRAVEGMMVIGPVRFAHEHFPPKRWAVQDRQRRGTGGHARVILVDIHNVLIVDAHVPVGPFSFRQHMGRRERLFRPVRQVQLKNGIGGIRFHAEPDIVFVRAVAKVKDFLCAQLQNAKRKQTIALFRANPVPVICPTIARDVTYVPANAGFPMTRHQSGRKRWP
jgi:hypothetical protein